MVPPGLSNVVAIAAGSKHSLALRNDGTVVMWGRDSNNQTNAPPESTNLVAISAGAWSSAGLRADGRVIEWGSPYLTPPSGLSNVVAVAIGETIGLALIDDEPMLLETEIEARLTPTGIVIPVPTQSGRVYALEYTASLEQVDWKLLPLVAGNGSLRELSDSTLAESQRFYRVRSW